MPDEKLFTELSAKDLAAELTKLLVTEGGLPSADNRGTAAAIAYESCYKYLRTIDK